MPGDPADFKDMDGLQSFLREQVMSLPKGQQVSSALELTAGLHEIRHSHDFLGTAYGLLVLYWSFARGKAIIDLARRGHRSPRDEKSNECLLADAPEYHDYRVADKALEYYEGPLPYLQPNREPRKIQYAAFDNLGLARYPEYAMENGLSSDAIVYAIGVRALTECAAFFVQLELVTAAFGEDLPQRCKESLSISSGPDGWRVVEPRVPDFALAKILADGFYHRVLLACVVLALETLPENFPSAGHILLEFAEQARKANVLRPSVEELDVWVAAQRSRFGRVTARGPLIGHLLNLDLPAATAAAHLAIPLDQLLVMEPEILRDSERYFKALYAMKLPLVPWLNAETLDVVPGTCSSHDMKAIIDYEWDLDVAEQLWSAPEVTCQLKRRTLGESCPQHVEECGRSDEKGMLSARHPRCSFLLALARLRGE